MGQERLFSALHWNAINEGTAGKTRAKENHNLQGISSGVCKVGGLVINLAIRGVWVAIKQGQQRLLQRICPSGE